MFRVAPRVLVIVALALPQSLYAWNAAGHKTITSIIFRRLPEERRMELAELLTHHPRFQEDFGSEMPESVKKDETERAEWLLQQASVWPDMVRGGPPERRAFNRPTWHYLPRAIYLSEPDAAFKANAESSMNSALDGVPGMDGKDLNGPQAFKANLNTLNDTATSKEERAVALCWVLHIGEDLHQPCHTGSLALPHLFPEGDRGGNSVKTKQLKNLHAVWDGSLGPDSRYEKCRDLAVVLLGEADSSSLNEAISDANAEMVKWLDEGAKLERDAVYIGELRDEILRVEPTSDDLGEINLSPDYMRHVRKVSDKRFLVAGVRLAELLK